MPSKFFVPMVLAVARECHDCGIAHQRVGFEQIIRNGREEDVLRITPPPAAAAPAPPSPATPLSSTPSSPTTPPMPWRLAMAPPATPWPSTPVSSAPTPPAIIVTASMFSAALPRSTPSCLRSGGSPAPILASRLGPPAPGALRPISTPPPVRPPFTTPRPAWFPANWPVASSPSVPAAPFRPSSSITPPPR